MSGSRETGETIERDFWWEVKRLVNPMTYYMTEETSMLVLARAYSHRHKLPVTPPGSRKRPQRQVWLTSRSRTGSGIVSNSGSAVLPQILSVVVWRHVIDVNLVAFLWNGKESGGVKRSISERGPCTGRPGLVRGACVEEGSKIKTHKSKPIKSISIINDRISLGIKDEVKASVSDISSPSCETVAT